MPNIPNILEIQNLSKKFGNFQVLNNISFNLEKGEVIGLIGANGAGKTTLTEIIAGIIKPTSGKIKYNFKYKKTFKEKIGMQFQDSTYPSGLTINDIVSFAKNLHKLKITQKEIKNLMETLQMLDLYNRKAKFLSGGQKQKLNIFLAILHSPKIILLDELTTGLDISTRGDVLNFTKNLLKSHNISAILISHNMHEIKNLCKNVIILSNGQIILKSSIKKIEEKYFSLEDYMKNLIISSNKDFKNGNKETNIKKNEKIWKNFFKRKGKL